MSELDLMSFILTTASEGGHGFNWAFVIKHALNLAILLGVLVYFLKIPLKNFLEERRANLSKEIDEAKNAIDKAKTIYEEYSSKLNSLELEINSLKESIQNQGEQEKADILKQAEATRELIKKESKETIEVELMKAKRDIQEEVVSSSVGLAEKIIKENLSDGDTSKSIDQFIKLVEEGKWLQSQH